MNLINALEADLKLALSASCFINIAKEKLNIPIHVPAIEIDLQKNAQDAAEALGLDADALMTFMDLYCQVSRKIQEHLRTQDKTNYPLSSNEKNVLELIKSKVPELSAVSSFAEINAMIEKNNGDLIAKSLLAIARELIASTNTKLFNGIKETADEGPLDQKLLNDKLTLMIHSIFCDEALNLQIKPLLKAWAESLSLCTVKPHSSFSHN